MCEKKFKRHEFECVNPTPQLDETEKIMPSALASSYRHTMLSSKFERHVTDVEQATNKCIRSVDSAPLHIIRDDWLGEME